LHLAFNWVCGISGSWHLASGIWYLASGIWHPVSGILHPLPHDMSHRIINGHQSLITNHPSTLTFAK